MLALFLTLALVAVGQACNFFFGQNGLLGPVFSPHPFLYATAYFVLMAHVTITAMSLCFHRQHTHQGVKFNRWVDGGMQFWLWFVTSMSKRDWVSVHVYHHAHSDDAQDPHSPVKKGFWHVFLLGAYDYNRAKSTPPVLSIRKRIPENRFEAFVSRNLLLGPMVLTTANLVLFGAFWGTVLSVLNFLTAPVFAVGGVNALAHMIGYRNHVTSDNSRNIGFLFPLNWIICGELDHNNHHRYPKSATFRHRWFEFDIGWAYILCLKWMGLAQVRSVYTWKKEPMQQLSTPCTPKEAPGLFGHTSGTADLA